ncbi:MAG: prephenate dehydratase domain-containing protein [Clostridium perfringens]|nr:prephenate dehydratase domain-containing protein [Clostridium perfringens]
MLGNKEKIIGYQGTLGSFSEEALVKYFGDEYNKKNYMEFEDVFKALKDREVDYGILPIENTTTGSITKVYDLLREYGFFIVGETLIKIEHNLLGFKDAKIDQLKEIYSHSQGFEQSSKFLSSLKSDIKLIPYHNTAVSVEYVSESFDKTKAAIGSKRAGDIYGLEVLKEAINNYKKNYTRFIVIGRQFESSEECDKISISFSLGNIPGDLYRELKAFHDNNINMIKIESRPIGDGSFNYYFYIDIDGNVKSENIRETLKIVSNNTKEYKLLGGYRRWRELT